MSGERQSPEEGARAAASIRVILPKVFLHMGITKWHKSGDDALEEKSVLPGYVSSEVFLNYLLVVVPWLPIGSGLAVGSWSPIEIHPCMTFPPVLPGADLLQPG